jgi:SpoVK/Ycf46/Vps4 family AAA+-type ATPase
VAAGTFGGALVGAFITPVLSAFWKLQLSKWRMEQALEGAVRPLGRSDVETGGFDGIIGQQEAKTKLLELVSRIRHPEFEAAYWQGRPEGKSDGYIMAGPAGTGKTALFHRLLNRAWELGLKISPIEVNLEKFLSGIPGSGPRAVDKLEEAILKAPHKNVFILLDEMDSAGAGEGRNVSSDIIALRSALLKLFNKFNTPRFAHKKITLIGTTNFYDRLDGAWKQRFNVVLPMNLPNPEEMKLIYQHYLGELGLVPDGNVDMNAIVKASDGYSSRIIKQAVVELRKNLAAQQREQWLKQRLHQPGQDGFILPARPDPKTGKRSLAQVTFTQEQLEQAIRQVDKNKTVVSLAAKESVSKAFDDPLSPGLFDTVQSTIGNFSSQFSALTGQFSAFTRKLPWIGGILKLS